MINKIVQGKISDCCKAEAADEGDAYYCQKCNDTCLLIYPDGPADLSVSVTDDVGMRDVPPGGR